MDRNLYLEFFTLLAVIAVGLGVFFGSAVFQSAPAVAQAAASPPDNSTQIPVTPMTRTLAMPRRPFETPTYRLIDTETGVVCYEYLSMMSCVAIGQKRASELSPTK